MRHAVDQAAALPVRDGLVCMVTSRNRRRWVIPKGRIESHQTPAEAALAEAWEEAGLDGALSESPVGVYGYEKDGRPHRATVFVLYVEACHDQYPERKERRREWVTVEEAIRRIDEPDLREVVRVVFADLLTFSP